MACTVSGRLSVQRAVTPFVEALRAAAWATKPVAEGKRIDTADDPWKCEDCPEDWRERWGCGCSRGTPWTASAEGEGYAGKAAEATADGARLEPWSRTCRQWFYRSPFVISVLNLLRDYRANRLGVVTQLPAPLATYLRVADVEFTKAQNYWDNARLTSAGNG